MTASTVKSELLRKYIEQQAKKELEEERKEMVREEATTMAPKASVEEGKIAYSEIGNWVLENRGVTIPGWKLPKGKPDFGVTVYNPEDWAEDVRTFIPEPGGHYFPDSHYEVAYAIETNSTAMIRGKPGCGKTSGVEAWCGIIGMPYARVTCHDEITMENFVGSKTLVCSPAGSSEVVPVPADVLRVAQHGGCACIDELPVAPQGVILALFPTFEVPRKIDITSISNGEHAAHMVKCHENFRVVITGNTGGGGDVYGDYAGVNQQNKALLDRIDLMVHLDYLPAKYEQELLKHAFPDVAESAIERVVEFSGLLRQGFDKRSLSLPWSLRGMKSWVRGFRHYGHLGNAFATLLLPKWEKADEQDAIRVLWQETFNEDMV